MEVNTDNHKVPLVLYTNNSKRMYLFMLIYLFIFYFYAKS